jgi:predicted Rossmann fold nucleotide-binding protein DprA/Smf involved in DNA uptake
MASRSDGALATLLLANRLVETGVAPLSAKRYWALREAVPDPAELLGAEVDVIRRRTGLAGDEADRIRALLSAGTGLAFELERLERQGLVALTPFDEAYPERLLERLGEQAPPVLYVVGDPSLLSVEGVGVVGSRDVGEADSEVARRAARTAVEAGLPVISGGARGVDQVSMAAAHEAGGSVVGYLADALERRVRDPDVRRAIAEGSTCLASPYKPSAGFSVASAMDRNKLVYAAARVTFVVAADLEHGGTWEGAVEALRQGFGPVAVWTGAGAGPGNDRLVELGATPVEDVATLLTAPAAPLPTGRSDQLRLGL